MPTLTPKKTYDWLKYNFIDLAFILTLIFLGVFIACRNYLPGTWLLGWDSLVPELNFKLNIVRSLSAVWQEYQGLGLLGGMAHAADLPREIFLWAASVIVPQSFLRYFWTFFMLVLGPLGVYFLVNTLVGPVGSSSHSTSSTIAAGAQWDSLRLRHPLSKLAGFVAAIFYLFNLATVQTFYVPFESFTSFFGLFPWLLFFAARYLEGGKKAQILSFFLFSLIAACAFYVQTLFIVYAIFLSIFAIETVVRYGKSGFARSVKLSFTTLAANAFWLLPVMYFSLTAGSVPGASHINSIATPETQLMNQAMGNFSDITQLKGYWFNYYDWFPGESSVNGKYDYMYKNWITYDKNPLVSEASITLFFISIGGLLISLFKKKTTFATSLLVLSAISYFMLAGVNPPFGKFYQLISDKIPLFADIFRNAYTKWSIPFALTISCGLGYFVYGVSDFLRGKLKTVIAIFLSAVVISGAIYTVYPVFTGNLISKNMEVNLPSSYLETINYFKDVDPSARIADFPLTDFWGWHFNSWGFEGSGFMWYGTTQPILDRTFDVWSSKNEDFYSEIIQAVNAKNPVELSYVLNKYQVRYILYDNSVFVPGNPDSSGILNNQKDFLESSGLLTKVEDFGSISIYQTHLQNSANSFVSASGYNYSGSFVTTGKVSSVPEVIEAFQDTQGYQNAHNCDLESQGSVTRIRAAEGNNYEADMGGSSCDYFYYPPLDYSKMYSMRITGENISGRSLKIYLYNVSKKENVLEELLPAGKFDKTYYIYPMTVESSSGEGYTLNVETRSFGNIKSENMVTGIYFYPVDHTLQGEYSIQNNLKISGVQKYGTFAYKIDVQGSGLIQLGQGYDSGWIATKLPINNYQFTILKHIKVNSWANGWVVPSNQPFNQSTIYLFYWPQVLEWGGGILGLLSFVKLIL